MDIPKGKSKQAKQEREKITKCPNCPWTREAFLTDKMIRRSASDQGAKVAWYFHLRRCTGQPDDETTVVKTEQEDAEEKQDKADAPQTRARSKRKWSDAQDTSKPKTEVKPKADKAKRKSKAEVKPKTKDTDDQDLSDEAKDAVDAFKRVFEPVLKKMRRQEEDLDAEFEAIKERRDKKRAEREKLEQNMKDMQCNLVLLDEMNKGE